MSKKGYPGLVLVPPSDRTVVRRRIVRWSLVGLALVWGVSTLLPSLSPSSKNDCQPSGTHSAPSTTDADCNQATTSGSHPQPRTEEAQPIPDAPPGMTPAEGQSSLTPPSSEFTTATSEQNTAHPSPVESLIDLHSGIDHTSGIQPEVKLASTQAPHQSTKPQTTENHQAAAQSLNAPAPQYPASSSQAATSSKVGAQPGSGSGPTPGFPQTAKPASRTADHKVMTQAPKEPAAPSTPNPPTKTAMPASPDHKLTGHAGQGAAPPQPTTKSVMSATHTGADRTVTIRSATGAGQPIAPHQSAKSASTADHKQPTQPHNGSLPHQTSPQTVTPKPSGPDRKVSAQLGNRSTSAPHQTPPTNSVAVPSGNGTSSDPPHSSEHSQDTRLAEEGDAFAQYRLGRFYAQQGGRQIPEAVKWYKKASNGLRQLAEAGNGQAMYVLGVMYTYGRGVKKDTDQARHWLSQAVSHKVTAARPLLANLDRD